MDASKMKGLRTALRQRQDEIQGEVDRMDGDLRLLGIDQGEESGSLGNHMADDGSNMQEAERITTIAGDLRELLTQIGGALERMDEGTYGTCQRCGKPIPVERLEAFPYVAYDIGCQSELERENALRTGH